MEQNEENALWKKYRRYNSEWQNLFVLGSCSLDAEESTEQDKQKSDFLVEEIQKGVGLEVRDHESYETTYDVDKRIAFVNKKVEPKHFMNVVKYHKAICSVSRKEELVKIINDTIAQNADILVMPELMVPFSWLAFLSERARQSNIAIVTGMEYFVNKQTIANYVVTILPFKDKYVSNSYIHIREKNYYSPKEGLWLEGYHYQVKKKTDNPKYTLFHWRKCYFSVFNCFELADITSRAKFKSKVDFIIAVEYNKDIHYFSDVVGSWARDIHCFIIQVNSSNYGDSKIIMPSKTEEKTLVQVKGGENTVVLMSKLPISELRDFQLADYVVQQDDKRFKFTPPGYEHEYALKRYNDERIKSWQM